jgi:hypothetical protein
MYDAVNPAAIPSSAPPPDYVLGYVNGRWPSYDALVAKYPAAIPVPISTLPGDSAERLAQGCDGEAGDYSPATAAHFAATKLVLGVVPFIYCSWSDWHDYQQACVDTGVLPAEVDWGIAAYPGIGPVPYPGSVFHQWVDWGTYDQSSVVDGWIPGRLVHPAPPEEAAMPVSQAVNFKPGQNDVFQVSFGVLWHKWLRGGGWGNESLTGPFSVVPITSGVKLPDQEPQVAILGTQCVVTVQDEAGSVWYFAQDASSSGWGVNKCP